MMDHELFVEEIPSKDDDEKDRAWYAWNNEGRMITVFYSHRWISRNEVELVEVDRVALHEIYESTMAEMREMLLAFYSRDYVDRVIHKNVRLIENAYLKKKGI
jgi:hypothetical protein